MPRLAPIVRLAASATLVALATHAAADPYDIRDLGHFLRTPVTAPPPPPILQPTPPRGHMDPRLAGAWTVVRLGGVDLDQPPLIVTFDNGRFGARGACNILMGAIAAQDGTFRLLSYGGTLMGCFGPIADRETALSSALGGATGYEITADGALVLISEGGVTLRAVPR